MNRIGAQRAELAVLVASLFLALSSTHAADKFAKECIPFSSPAVHHPLDQHLWPPWQPDHAAGRLQNLVKNNFCATGTPKNVLVARVVQRSLNCRRAG